MTIAGIVAEYNPFHLGHEYQIQETRRILGEDTAIVCVMSGDFVQRGEPAIFSKYARAEAAVRCGVDLVIELPLPWSVASAERFAEGAIQILGKLGCVDYLSFGSETGNLKGLLRVTETLELSAFNRRLRELLSLGISYPSAREQALREFIGEDADFVQCANDTLGIEYLKAIRRGGFSIEPIAIKRMGAGHDEISEQIVKSGSELRMMLKSGQSIGDHLPEQANQVFLKEIQQGRGPISNEDLEPMILSRLRMLDQQAFSSVPDAAEGLEQKLYAACQEESSLEAVYSRAKSKRYTHARIRRMTLCAALGLQKELLDTPPEYARIHAFNERGRDVLNRAKKTAMIDIISKPATGRDLNGNARNAFLLTEKAHDLYVLGFKNASFRSGGQGWRTSPMYIYE